ncbi:uncharacterized protein LOC120194329 [Hibiscus syriacus]|uniref:uncharacterized protein LOC120194329 n=1 Tax=Hibiscus syriacus TaxID=106335 RepID=UPI00192208CF|nr:uncharacterized protein LOC120194329 [Hibiscus syriacus]
MELNLRQHHFLKLLNDYDCEIDYHLGKTNVVADALSRKVIANLRTLFAKMKQYDDGTILAELQVKPTLVEEIKAKQILDSSLLSIIEQVEQEFKHAILSEAHSSPYAMHPGRDILESERECVDKQRVIDHLSPPQALPRADSVRGAQLLVHESSGTGPVRPNQVELSQVTKPTR